MNNKLMEQKIRFNDILGGVIRYLRNLKKISQLDAAFKSGIGKSTWSRIESGDTSLTVCQLWKISKCLDMDLIFFYIKKIIIDLNKSNIEIVFPKRSRDKDHDSWFLGPEAIENLLRLWSVICIIVFHRAHINK